MKESVQYNIELAKLDYIIISLKVYKTKKCRIFTNPALLFSPLFLKKHKEKRFTINLSFNFSKNLLQRYYFFL